MRQQPLSNLLLRAVCVKKKLLGDCVPSDDGLEVVPSSPEQTIYLGAPAFRGITVEPPREVDARTSYQRKRSRLKIRNSPTVDDEFRGLLKLANDVSRF
jgi:hypothetical protein